MNARRRRWITVGAAAVVAVAAGMAYAATTAGTELINGCVLKESGQLRVVTDPGACRAGERPVSWSAEARATRSFEAGQFSPEVTITAVGTTPIGMPTDESPGTPIVSLTLPQGVYAIKTLADVRKPTGSEIFSCRAREAATGQWTALARAALGNDAGYARWVALSGTGFFNAGAGGSTLTLECWNWQSTGENPIVFFSTIDAVPVTSATITVNGGSPIAYP